MDIVMKKVEELVPYESNPRINDYAVEAVANSIREFGFKVPMVVTDDDVIVSGHTRLKAAIFLGLREVPCIIASDLTDEQIRAFRLADNKVGELADWDHEKMLKELDLLNDLDIDMSLFGFSDIGEVHIGDMWEEIAPKVDVNHLSWADKKTEIDEDDISLLDKLYEDYNKDDHSTFVKYLSSLL